MKLGPILAKGFLTGVALVYSGNQIYAQEAKPTQVTSITISTPQENLASGVNSFFKSSIPSGYDLSSKEIIEMYGWVLKLCCDSEKLDKNKQDIFIKEQVESLVKRYPTVTKETAFALTESICTFRKMRNEWDNTSVPPRIRVKHGELFPSQLTSKVVQFAQAANMSTNETNELILYLLGNNREITANYITSKAESFETNSRARKIGLNLSEKIRNSN